jgi:IclR family transcriptional regulator, pca regulon regulatory protein
MKNESLNKVDWIAGLERGLAILACFDNDHPTMTATQAAERAGLNRTAARRYLLTLAHLGYLHSDGKKFGLTPRVLKLGWSYLDSAALPRLLMPFLQRVTATLNESVYVCVLDGWDSVCIARNGTSRVMTSGFALGSRLPAHLASPGIAMLGFQPQQAVLARMAELALVPFTPHTITDYRLLYREVEKSRELGYALLEQQMQTGVRGIAMPLKNRNGQLVAAMSVSMPIKNETTEEAVERVLPVLQETANSLINHL